MNRVAQRVGPNEEGLDALLGAFFRAEMPSPWPARTPPRPRTLPFRRAAARPKAGLALASRLALAAAVAVLVLAAWLMPRGPSAVPGLGPVKVGPGDAHKHHGKELFVPKIDGLPAEAAPGGNVKSSLQLEQKDGRGTIRIDVMELPPANK